jgi:acyl-CoA thioesterase
MMLSAQICKKGKQEGKESGRLEIEAVRTFFQRDRWLVAAGVHIDEVGEDFARCSMDICDMHLNAADVVQGGATYTLADSAFAVACNAGFVVRGEARLRVSQSASITYFRPPKDSHLIATARKIEGGNKVAVFEIAVEDGQGTKVALMIGNGYLVETGTRV